MQNNMRFWSRRRFCSTMFLAGLGPSLAGTIGRNDSAPLAFADEKPAVPKVTIPFGYTLYGMRKLSLAEALRVCAEVGYDGVELACMEEWPGAPELLSPDARKELASRLRDHHLALLSVMENLNPLANESGHQKNLDRLKRAFDLARELSSEKLPVLETVLGGKPSDWEAVREPMAKRLEEWGRIAEEAKIVIALKPHVSGALHSPEGAVWLMNRLNHRWLKLAYDFSHFELQEFDLKASLNAMLPQTSFIHIKDSKGKPGGFQFLLPGDGRTNYTEYFSELRGLHTPIPMVVEVSGQLHTKPDFDPVAAARRSYQYLAPLLEAADLRRKSK